ncbi:Dynamitin-domain-containing protein [Lipomyces kononenkoae]|uniref:Dynamitin-domain-containing protein n=1 Tax=Lipomyces kononenkoae TaxID=34357 RepID=A0ACC3T9Q0_LIPKO
MPILEKYQSLPGLDTRSPDVFETPDLEEAISRVEIPDTPSVPGTVNDEIDYSNISVDVARERFLNKTLNSTNTTDDHLIESTEMKIARLKKEIEELAAALEASNVEQAEKAEKGNAGEFNEVSELANTMRSIVLSRQDPTGNVLRSFGTKSEYLRAGYKPLDSEVPLSTATGFNPSMPNDAENARLLDLDNRLSRLEKVIGNTSSIAFNGTFHATVFEQPVIPTLSSLSQKVNSLTSSPEKLDATLARVRQLVAAVEKASSGNTSKLPTGSHRTPLSGEAEDKSQADKIESIYSSLASVEKLIQIVPGLVDRLRSLQFLHSEAGETISNLGEIRDKTDTVEGHISKWRIALESAEKRLDEIEDREKRNLDTAREWVKDLESKVKSL